MTGSELMKAMADAGAPFDAILIAIRAIEERDAVIAAKDAEAAADIEALLLSRDRPRSKAAIRQERYRRNKTSQNVTSDAENVTGVTGDVTRDDQRNTGPLPLPPNDNNSNPPTPAPENNSRVREAADSHVTDWQAWRDRNPFPRQHWAPAPLWADFLKNRKLKKRPNTMTAHDRLLSDMAKVCARTGWPPGKVFRACVEQGWAGIYETDEMKATANANGNGGNQRSAQRRNSGVRDNRDGFKLACDDWIDEIERSAADEAGRGGQLALGGPDTL